MGPSSISEALARVTAALPAGEARPGQEAMAQAVARAIETGEHVLVQAGTGTGKGLGYLVPAILSGKRVVVATATKALQEQLTDKDLPFLEKHLGVPFTYALLKGRSNYLCLARAAEVNEDAQSRLIDPQHLDGKDDSGAGLDALLEIVRWARTSTTGDRADAPHAVSNAAWSALSVSSRECPGKAKCAYGEECYAERARDRAGAADVIVVNTHLYAMHLASGGFVLPEHDIVVVDEAHALEDIAADSFGVEVSAGRCGYLAAALRGLFTREATSPASVDDAGRAVEAALTPLVDRRVNPATGDLATSLLRLAEVITSARREVAALDANGPASGRRQRTLQLADALLADLRRLDGTVEGDDSWVARTPSPALRSAPVDVAPILAERLFEPHTVVLTSATLTVGGEFEPVARRLGVPAPHGQLDAGSPFHYEEQALLYCAAHLPDPRAPGYGEAVAAEITRLAAAAGGRTLALFTSRRALTDAVARVRTELPYRVLVQDEQSRSYLLREFSADESSCLFATMSFWQGIDVPGPALSLVVIDRLPFPRPDDPLLSARREAAQRRGEDPFRAVDVPRAAMLLAQGVGRLIRSATDRGVVAVLDRRLATAPYRWSLVRSLPPLRRTRDSETAATFLRSLQP